MAEPLAFFITWTCYGTWLHGDERGSVDIDHNVPGTPLAPVRERRVAAAQERMTHPPVHLNEEGRRVVADTIVAHCLHRGWELCAVNVRSNHVHVVLAFAGCPPENMMGELKAWSTRRLRKRGLVTADQAVWTTHGSTRYLWKMKEVTRAVEYVLEGQGPERFGERER